MHEGRLDRQLCGCKAEGLARIDFGHAFELIQHLARLDLGDPPLDVALTGAHSDFQRITGDRDVRKDADPHLAATLDVTRDDTTGRFDLASSERTALSRLQAELAEADLVAILRKSAVMALLLLSKLGSLGLHHGSTLLISGVKENQADAGSPASSFLPA